MRLMDRAYFRIQGALLLGRTNKFALAWKVTNKEVITPVTSLISGYTVPTELFTARRRHRSLIREATGSLGAGILPYFLKRASTARLIAGRSEELHRKAVQLISRYVGTFISGPVASDLRFYIEHEVADILMGPVEDRIESYINEHPESWYDRLTDLYVL